MIKLSEGELLDLLPSQLIADAIGGANFAPKGKIAMKTQSQILELD